MWAVLLKAHWPVLVALLYLAYVATAVKTDLVPGAVTAVIAAFGLASASASAHKRIDALKP